MLQDERVVVLTNAAIVCLLAPGFAAVHRDATAGKFDAKGSAPDVPVAELRWAVLWQVPASHERNIAVPRQWQSRVRGWMQGEVD